MTFGSLRHLYQPGNPVFWLMLVLNFLSSILIWMLYTREWPTAVVLVLTVFALGNAALGIRLVLRLLKGNPEK